MKPWQDLERSWQDISTIVTRSWHNHCNILVKFCRDLGRSLQNNDQNVLTFLFTMFQDPVKKIGKSW
jgi:hypothetical protein